MRYLVTGSAGLIGNNLVSVLEKSGKTVYSCFNNIKPQYGIPVKLDLLNFDEISKVFNDVQPDIVIHLAALTDVEKCEEEPELANSINVKATEIIAKESATLQSYLIYLSTDYVFDGKTGMYSEIDITNPLNQYGKTKLFGEKAITTFTKKYTILRTSTPFGTHSHKKTFPIWLLENIQNNKKINVLEDQFTSPTFVPNLNKMILEIVSRNLEGLFHLSGSSKISRYEFAKKILKALKLDDSLLIPVKTNSMHWKACRPLDSSLDISKIYPLLTTKPLSIEASLENFLPELRNSFSL